MPSGSRPARPFLRVGAQVVLGAAIVVVSVLIAGGDLARAPGGTMSDEIRVPLQFAILGLLGVGLLLSFRWVAPAAATVALGASGFAVLSAAQFESSTPIIWSALLLIPAVMLWFDRQPRKRLVSVAAAAAAVLLVGAAWVGSIRLHDHLFGPTHPESDAPDVADSVVDWLWTGAVTPTGFTVTAMLDDPTAAAQLRVVEAATGDAVGTSTVGGSEPNGPIRFTTTELEPATEYRYAIEVDGVADEQSAGTVSTFPDRAASLTIAFGACARTGSNGAVFDTIRRIDPDLYVILGDLHYRNIADDDPEAFAAAYDRVHDSAAQSLLYRTVPIAYVWDDHDFGPNDSDSTSASRPAAWSTFRSHVPHYDLVTGEAGPIHQAFSIGRVRVVMLDTRSERLEPAGTLLGRRQLQWLFDELGAARDTHALTILVSPTAWIGPAEQGADHWGAFAAERAQIGAFLAANEIDNLVLVGGDAHMVAIDDGTNSGYGGHGGFPVLQAAALDRPGSVKGGPYTNGIYPGGGRFGAIEVRDDGGPTVAVELIGLNWEGTVLNRLETTFTVG